MGDVGSCRDQYSNGPAETKTADGATLQRSPLVNLQDTSPRDDVEPTEAEADGCPSLKRPIYIQLPDSRPYYPAAAEQYTLITGLEYSRASPEYQWVLGRGGTVAENDGASIATDSH